MAETWATSGRRPAPRPAGAGACGPAWSARCARRSRRGRLPPGTRLPSSRALAADLGVARNTVADAYGQLVAEGWLAARQGSGTRVAERAARPATARREPAAAAARARATTCAPGSPDLAALPARAPGSPPPAARSHAAPSDALGYGDPRGRPELRQALAGYLARARGVRVDARTGSWSAPASPRRWRCSAGCCAARGARTLAVEALRAPAAPRGRRRRRPAACSRSPVDGDGRRRRRARRRAGAVLLTPAHQFPLGVPLAPQRRTAGRRVGAPAPAALIIEDDYDGEFRYDRQPVGAMQALAPEHVVYAGTASKSLAPGLRLGWLVVPGAAAWTPVVEAKAPGRRRHAAPSTSSRWPSSSAPAAYDRHVRRCRLAYRRRRDRLVAALRRRVPRCPGHRHRRRPARARPAARRA